MRCTEWITVPVAGRRLPVVNGHAERELRVLASIVRIHDGDYWSHALLRGGVILDRFASMPDYFTDDPEKNRPPERQVPRATHSPPRGRAGDEGVPPAGSSAARAAPAKLGRPRPHDVAEQR